MGFKIIEPNTNVKISIEPFELDCDIHHLAKKIRDTADFLDRLEGASIKKGKNLSKTEGLCVELPWEAEPLRMLVREEWENEEGENDYLDSAWLFCEISVQKKSDDTAVTTIWLQNSTSLKDYEELTVAEAIEKKSEKTYQQFKGWLGSKE